MISRKITYNLDFLPTYVFREIAELVAREIKIDVFLPLSDTRSKFWIDIISGEAISEGISIRECLSHYPLTCSLLPLVRLFFTQCLPMFLRHPLCFVGSLLQAIGNRSLRFFILGASLARRIDTQTLLIHSHFAGVSAFAAMWAGKMLNIPFTLTTHAVDIFVPQREELVKYMFEESHSILTISHFNREYISSRFGEHLRSKIVVTHLGLDPGSLPDRIVNIDSTPLLVCTASGLGQKKGVPILVEACEVLHRRNINFKCVVIGSDSHGNMLEQYRKMTVDSALGDNLEFKGMMLSKDVIEWLRKADVFVLPSALADDGNMDGIPVSLMESMGMGIPTISTTISGIPELIDSGRNGILVPPGDSAALADALEKLLTCREYAEELGREGAKKVRSDFNVSGYINSLLDVWSCLIDSAE